MTKRKRVGFTCSSFDLLHPGHVVMLEDCKTVCDYLIIGLQTDPTFDRKSKNKPVQTIDERKIMISAIKHVDEVMLYQTEQELYALLRNLKPDVRILGTDWKGQTFTGYDLDIPIHWHNRDHDWSTSELRARIYRAESEKNV